MNIEDLIARLNERYDSLGDGRDCKSQNEKADWFAASSTTARLRSILNNLPDDIAKVEAHVATLDAQRTAVLAKRTEIEQQIASAPDLSTFEDLRERDRERERQRQLQLSLGLLRRGGLLYAPEARYPRLDDLDAKIATVQAQLAVMRGNLQHYIGEAEALLTGAVTSVSS